MQVHRHQSDLNPRNLGRLARCKFTEPRILGLRRDSYVPLEVSGETAIHVLVLEFQLCNGLQHLPGMQEVQYLIPGFR